MVKEKKNLHGIWGGGVRESTKEKSEIELGGVRKEKEIHYREEEQVF